jgi:hypothetical protein
VSEAVELNPNSAYAQKLQSKSDAAKKLSNTHPQILTVQNKTVIQANDTQNTHDTGDGSMC